MKPITHSLFFLGLLFNYLQGVEPLSNQDIDEIFKEFVKINYTEEYKHRYDKLPMEKNNLQWRWEGKDFSRVIALLEFERFITENNLTSVKGLAINGKDPEWDYLPYQVLYFIDYDADPINHDLHTLNLNDKDFDFAMLNQTLEHVYDPIRCLKKVYEHMRPGGILYLNVPANNIPHSTPFHYYTGITPVGLGAMAKAAGFKILNIGQWGNLEYTQRMYSAYGWPDYTEFKNPGYNDIMHPIITWIFAIKPEE